MAEETDTPVNTPFPRPTLLEQIKAFVGDLARPFAIISTSLAASIATVAIALRVKTFGEGALYIGAVFAGVGALYGARAWEKVQDGKRSAEVEIAKAAPTAST